MMYTATMEISITQLRQNLFEVVNQAMEGKQVWVTYKGRRFRIAPEESPPSRLDRMTPLEVIAPGVDLDNSSMLEEMERAWEKDWSEL
ncbi:type II toxin-antitoxin system prevent-host-death family antitoxin [Silvibacterium dinghuense]|nr:type II toxin-antitoxin system prevent-host-death family antitoxin [Silvibacterium dinghuense]